MADRYWVPTSLPWRIPCVGSWFSQKTLSRSANVTRAGSYTTWTTSACPVYPEQTSSYVGFGVTPPAYPTAVEITPGIFQNIFSAPQKQPMPKTASWAPSGQGPVWSYRLVELCATKNHVTYKAGKGCPIPYEALTGGASVPAIRDA